MRTHHLIFAVVALLCVLIYWLVPWAASAAIPASIPAAAYGAVQVSSSTATKVPGAPMGARYAIAIQNLGPNDIWCGWGATVTTATGWKVAANGGVMATDTGYDGQTGRNQLWCIASTATQVSPLDTRYQEIR